MKLNLLEYYFGEMEHGVNRKSQVMKLSGDQMDEVKKFKYLGSVLKLNGGLEQGFGHRIKGR